VSGDADEGAWLKPGTGRTGTSHPFRAWLEPGTGRTGPHYPFRAWLKPGTPEPAVSP